MPFTYSEIRDHYIAETSGTSETMQRAIDAWPDIFSTDDINDPFGEALAHLAFTLEPPKED